VVVAAVTHGGQQPVPPEAATADDPDLWLVTADQRAWQEAHPCRCDALCVCDRDEERE